MQCAVGVLLQKAHIYETLVTLQNCVEQVIELTPAKETFWNISDTNMDHDGEERTETVPLEEDSDGGVRDEKKEDGVMEVTKKDILSPPMVVLPPELITNITGLLNDLNQSLNKIDNLILLPLKVFPGVCTPEQTMQEVFVGVARMCKSRRLLECLLVLLTAPTIIDIISIFRGIGQLFLTFLSTQNGNYDIY